MRRFAGRKWMKKVMDDLVKFGQTVGSRKPFLIAMRNPARELGGRERSAADHTKDFHRRGYPRLQVRRARLPSLYKFTGYYRALEGRSCPRRHRQRRAKYRRVDTPGKTQERKGINGDAGVVMFLRSPCQAMRLSPPPSPAAPPRMVTTFPL